MTEKQVKISEIKRNPANPRVIRDEKYTKLLNSLLVFPKMLQVRPIVVDKQMVVLGGNMRLKALQEIAKFENEELFARLQKINEWKEKDQSEQTEIFDFWLDFATTKKLNVAVADDFTDKEASAFIIKDNNNFGEFDYDLLNNWDSELLEDWGVDVDFAIEEEKKEVVEDEVPEEVETRCKLGDIWQLGTHRLICGDSTNPAVIDRLMDGVKADMVFTDPPYGMKKESEGVLNDNLNFDDLLDFNRQWIPLTFGALKDNGSWYCWGIDEPLMDIYSNILKPMIKDKRITFRNLITWRKGAFGSGGGTGVGQAIQRSYFPEDEKCLFVMMGVQGFSNNADNYFEAWEPIRTYLKQERDRMGWSNADMKKMCGHSPTSGCHWFDKSQWMMPTEEEYKTWQHHAKGEGFKKEYEEIKKEYYSTRAYFDNTHDMMTNVWDFGRVRGDERAECGGHATPKPIALCSRAIKSSSREGEIVLDVFGGSGSTLIACEQLNRKCYMCELDEHYCDIILQRWENLTNKKATKIK